MTCGLSPKDRQIRDTMSRETLISPATALFEPPPSQASTIRDSASSH